MIFFFGIKLRSGGGGSMITSMSWTWIYVVVLSWLSQEFVLVVVLRDLVERSLDWGPIEANNGGWWWLVVVVVVGGFGSSKSLSCIGERGGSWKNCDLPCSTTHSPFGGEFLQKKEKERKINKQMQNLYK